MKKWLLIDAALALVALSVISCTSPQTAQIPRFHEEMETDMVFQFYRWDSIYLIKPDSRQDGFLPVLTRDNIANELKRRPAGRHLAVVVVGFTYVIDNESSLVQDWKVLLGEQGFHRVVFLRAGGSKEINGLPILHDSVIAGANDTSGPARATVATLPSPAGANAPYPSSHTIQ